MGILKYYIPTLSGNIMPIKTTKLHKTPLQSIVIQIYRIKERWGQKRGRKGPCQCTSAVALRAQTQEQNLHRDRFCEFTNQQII